MLVCPTFAEGRYLLDKKPILALPVLLVTNSNTSNRMAQAGDSSFKFLPYQLQTVVSWTTVALTGDGELGFDSGEGA